MSEAIRSNSLQATNGPNVPTTARRHSRRSNAGNIPLHLLDYVIAGRETERHLADVPDDVVIDATDQLLADEPRPDANGEDTMNADQPVEVAQHEDGNNDAQIQDQENNTRLKWGALNGLDVIRQKVLAAYQELVKWKKNFFEIPKGNVGVKVLEEVTKMLKTFNDDSPWKSISLYSVHIFLPLMLQKPAKNSKRKDHVRYLIKRLKWWKDGDLQKLIEEGKEIQHRLRESVKKESSNLKGFIRLMLEGKVRQALKLVDKSSIKRRVTSIKILFDFYCSLGKSIV